MALPPYAEGLETWPLAAMVQGPPAKKKALVLSKFIWEGLLFALLEAYHHPLGRVAVTDRARVGAGGDHNGMC